MHQTENMLQKHPRKMQGNLSELTACVYACYECTKICTACADACLGEQDLQMLLRCIRLNLDCADVCEATGKVLTRQTEADWQLVRAQLEACLIACQVCGEECEKHARHHEHCRICAEACRHCGETCRVLLGVMQKAKAA